MKRKNKSIILGISFFVIALSFIIHYTNFENIPNWNQINSFFNIDTNVPIEDYKNYSMSMHIIDVGKADAIYIKANDKNILIDAGETDTKDVVLKYLKHFSIEKFDLIILTHQHKDHMGAMPEIINKYKIDKFMMPQLPENLVPTTKTYKSVLNSLNDHKVFVELPEVGKELNIGKLNIKILGPSKIYDNINNNSIVLKLTYENDSFLMMGDAEKESEKDILNLLVDIKSKVLKVGHHGSKTSTTYEFLNKVNPEYAVISVGPDANNLPKDAIINNLNKNNIKTYRTDKDGTVVVMTNGNGINIGKF